MIVDVTGICLTPGYGGADCPGNGKHFDASGNRLECCCDECNYMICCFYQMQCDTCTDSDCPRKSDAI
ncbi:MAG: hypothetical protein Q3985_03875 [Eubacteriales bacterium]|nr:hypothetical protein [Eubacteriales bacterium]